MTLSMRWVTGYRKRPFSSEDILPARLSSPKSISTRKGRLRSSVRVSRLANESHWLKEVRKLKVGARAGSTRPAAFRAPEPRVWTDFSDPAAAAVEALPLVEPRSMRNRKNVKTNNSRSMIVQ